MNEGVWHQIMDLKTRWASFWLLLKKEVDGAGVSHISSNVYPKKFFSSDAIFS